jgi:hypothetical protein
VAQRARENALAARAAADRMRAEATRAVETPNKLVETPAEVRAEVMSERGMNAAALMRLPPLARLEAEISISAETAARAHKAQIRTTGNFVDLLV